MNKKFALIIALLPLALPGLAAAAKTAPKEAGLYDIPVTKIGGEKASLKEYKGKVLLVVNTASQCGFTPQYAGLESLYQKYKDRGLVVAAFPANDFGGQEPGTEAEIKKFCEMKYKTTFPLYGKVSVKTHPLFVSMQKEAGAEVGWNFGKFLVGRDGKVKQYFPSKVKPDAPEIATAVEAELGK